MPLGWPQRLACPLNLLAPKGSSLKGRLRTKGWRGRGQSGVLGTFREHGAGSSPADVGQGRGHISKKLPPPRKLLQPPLAFSRGNLSFGESFLSLSSALGAHSLSTRSNWEGPSE